MGKKRLEAFSDGVIAIMCLGAGPVYRADHGRMNCLSLYCLWYRVKVLKQKLIIREMQIS
jgi:hypothetical protein